MKILLDLGDLDTIADDDEVLSIVRNVVANTHQLDNGELLHIESVTAEVVESASSSKPARSFLTWIKQQAKRDDPVGDLARDVRRDANAPKGRVSKTGWLGYLRASSASSGAIEAFREAWEEFSSQHS
ncbi:YozE family protein [Burkholderia cepacia]|uniref:YozE family protein n=1 Tax=Burkholderia cepacia TaxID=292 RepID=UPI000AA9A16E|nr:YozE family protein [Burkholderia cepacia]